MPEEVRVKVPPGFSELLEDSVIERRTVRSLAKKRLKELKEERREAEGKIKEFEDEYGAEFGEFEEHMQESPVGKDEIEDYNEWSFWINVRDKNTKLIDRVKSIA